LTIELIDSDGTIVKSKDTFSDKNGKISNSELRIPSTAKPGKWAINVKSGPNFDKVNINVVAAKEDGLVVTATTGVEIPGFGKSIDIKVVNANGEVSMKITSSDGDEIASLSFHASSKGEIKQPWFVPAHTTSGTYTLKVTDATGASAEATFIIN